MKPDYREQWNNEEIPFVLEPVGKDYLWGGSRLNDDYSKGIDLSPLAETWECSTHSAGVSKVKTGYYAGLELREVLRRNPEMMGRHQNEKGELPILIKLIDAKEDLSIQVHPDDEFAACFENGSLGKTEMWYVLDAEKDARIIYGFSRNTSEEEIKEALKNGEIESLLQSVPIEKNQVFAVNPGTVHAIGKGSLLAEVQESSDLTYRLYDYDRLDKNGKARELHIDKAVQVLNYSTSDKPKQPIRVLKYTRGSASEVLFRCKFFETERLLVNTERCRNYFILPELKETFQVLLCTDGCGVLTAGCEVMDLFKGDCVFIPAGVKEMRFHGVAQFLKVRC